MPTKTKKTFKRLTIEEERALICKCVRGDEDAFETFLNQFDPHVHEAVLAVESDEHSDGMVTEEVRAGYKRNDRLLRLARVKVAKNKGEDNG